jgi:hypothetical protein
MLTLTVRSRGGLLGAELRILQIGSFTLRIAQA